MKKIKEFKNKIESNKPLRITYKIIKFICSVLLLMMLAVILFQKFTNNNFAIGGYRFFGVVTGSMADEYPIGDIIVIRETPASELKIGDNVTYIGKEGSFSDMVITHKIISIRKDENNYFFTTRGTNKSDGTKSDDILPDPEISYSQIYGKVIYKTVLFSYINRIMLNVYSYYILFTLVGLVASFQVVKAIYSNGDDDEEEETTDNS